jgi:hypothetical protein
VAKHGLYDPSETTDIPGWLMMKYGTADIPDEQTNMVRLAMTGHIRDSYNWFASNLVWISDKRGRRSTLHPFVGQAIHRVTLDSQLRAGLPGYMVEVKVRQLGWTIECLARGLHYCLDEDRRALILVDDEDVATEQALRFNMMLNGLPAWLQPMRRIQNMKHVAFENPNPKDRMAHPGLNSSIQITVPSSFRGAPPGFVCISEYAHMDTERQDQIQQGIISAAAMTPNTIIIVDSTPAGYDASYEPMVKEAIADNPRWTRRIEQWKGELSARDVMNGILGIPDSVEKGYPTMVPAICFWRIHEEYDCKSKSNPRGELPPLTKAQKAETEATLGKSSRYGGDEELELRDKYGVSTSRLFWRRRKIDRYKMPTEEMKLLTFRQEFAGATVEEAFVESGKAPFPRDCLDALRRQKRTPIAVGLFEREDTFAHWEFRGEPFVAGEGMRHRDRNAWQEIRIYAGPENGEKYTMGVDCDVAYESPESDASVAQVVRFRDSKVVATYKAKVGSAELMLQLYCLYRWYWNCYYAIETAGMGYDLVRRCIDRGMGNAHYYKRYDADNPEPTKFPGWETSKPFMRQMMDQTLLEMLCHRDRETAKATPLFNIPDAETINEICNLSRTPSGSFKSSRGHDDHVDALDIALCIAQDPYSGLSRNQRQEPEMRKEFENEFAWATSGPTSRNRPNLASI